MAIIAVGPVVSDIRGSINGVTFGRNRAGLFARQRVVPVDPNTPAQVFARAIMAAASIAWRNTLTPAQRTAWNLLGLTTVFKNALGQDFNPSGIMLYVRSVALAFRAGQIAVSDPPTEAVIQLGTLTFAYTALAGIEITSVVGTEVTNGEAIGQKSPDLSQGISFFKGPFAQTLVFPVEDFAAPPVLVIPIADLLPGRRYFMRMRVIQDDGSATAAQIHFVDTPTPL